MGTWRRTWESGAGQLDGGDTKQLCESQIKCIQLIWVIMIVNTINELLWTRWIFRNCKIKEVLWSAFKMYVVDLMTLYFILRALKILLGSFLVILAVKIDRQASCQQ